MSTVRDKISDFVSKIRNQEDFPIKIPILIGSAGYDPVTVPLVLQKKDGKIVLFWFSWNSSWDDVSSEYKEEEYSDLRELFKKQPNLITLI